MIRIELICSISSFSKPSRLRSLLSISLEYTLGMSRSRPKPASRRLLLTRRGQLRFRWQQGTQALVWSESFQPHPSRLSGEYTLTSGFRSLVDQSMAPFTTCYLLIYVLDLVMLAGNHALPMMLRLIIWLGTKIWPHGETNETLNFLLDHPRR